METRDEKIARLRRYIDDMRAAKASAASQEAQYRQELADTLAPFAVGEVVLYRGIKWVISQRKLSEDPPCRAYVKYYGRQLKKDGEPSLRELHMYQTDKIMKVTP